MAYDQRTKPGRRATLLGAPVTETFQGHDWATSPVMVLHAAPLMTAHFHLTHDEWLPCELEREAIQYRLNTYSRNEEQP